MPCSTCIDLGTGTGGILSSIETEGVFCIGVDHCMEALQAFDTTSGSPVLCAVSAVSRTFRRGCADLVVTNPPYYPCEGSRISPNPFRASARTGDYLTVYRFIFAGAHLLRKGGTLLLSGKPSEKESLKQGLRAAGFHNVTLYRRGGVMVLGAERL